MSTAAEGVRFQVEQAQRRRQALLALKDEVADTRKSKAPARRRQLQQTHSEAGFTAENWKSFLLEFAGDVDGILDAAINAIDLRIRALSGPGAGEVAVAVGATPSATPLIPDGSALHKQTLSLLNKEVERLRALIGVDTENAKAFGRLSEKISRDEAGLAKLDRDIGAAQKADERIKELIQARRRDSYAAVFDGIIDEERELTSLYSPLKARLEAEEGALGKLSFSIRRAVDVTAWAQQGEDLLDLRKTGPFKGRHLRYRQCSRRPFHISRKFGRLTDRRYTAWTPACRSSRVANTKASAWPLAHGDAGRASRVRATPWCITDKKNGPEELAAASPISAGALAERKNIQPAASSGPIRQQRSFAASRSSERSANG